MRAVILGAGSIGDLHRRSAQAAGAEIVGAMASSPERSAEVAAAWGTGPLAELDGLAALAPDVVHVCTPNAWHARQVRAALAAGAHVICEKPLATSAAEAEGLADAAREAGRVATVPFVNRFHPMIREIRARALGGELGAYQLIHGSYLQDWMLSPAVTDWRVDPARGGPSRAFADIGSHLCDLMEFATGERIASLVADTAVTVPQRPSASVPAFSSEAASGPLVDVVTEDVAGLLFRTRTGVLGTATVSQVSAGRANRLWIEVDGATHSAVFDQEDADAAWIGGPDGSETLRAEPAGEAPGGPGGDDGAYARAFEAFVADTYRAVRGEKPDGLPTFADGAHSARLVEALLESARTRAWVDV